MPQLVRTIPHSEIQRGQIKAIDVRGKSILLVNEEGNIYALGRECTHEKADLLFGSLADGKLICPLHASEFDLKTGECLLPPAEDPLPIYNAKVIDGYVCVEVDDE